MNSKSNMIKRKQLERISKKVDIIIDLTALWATKSQGFEYRVKTLHRFFTIDKIAKMLGRTQKEVKDGLKFKEVYL